MAFLLVATSAAAQPAPARSPENQPSPPPAGWVIEVTSSGGITGRGKGGVVAQWDGTLACTPPLAPCGKALTGESLVKLEALVNALTAPNEPAASRGVCSDCFVTTLVVKRPAADGGVVVMSYRWNDVEFAALPPAVRQLHAAVMGAR